jgi:phosphatidylinositol glycan class B
VTSWFWFYTASRTLINTLEAILTMIALSFYPWGPHNEDTGFLWIVALLSYIRPTAAISWIPLCIYHMKKSKYLFVELFFKRYLFIGLVVGAALAGLDSYFHGSLIFTPWEFLKVNVINEIGSFYGTHPWYWYFSSGLPAVLGIGLIPFLLSVFSAIKSWDYLERRQVLLVSIILTIFVYSLLPHKEFRFLLQILPMCLYCITKFMAEWSRTKPTPVIWLAAIVILVSNLIPAGYLGVVHQQGTIKVMEKLATVAKENNNAKIFFMMPCHTTPYYSHIHVNVSMRFLHCEPNLDNKQNYVDEADQFYKGMSKYPTLICKSKRLFIFRTDEVDS